jgi:hypothetical protein
LKIIGEVTLYLRLCADDGTEIPATVDVLVSPVVTRAILGRNFLGRYETKLNYGEASIVIKGHRFSFSAKPEIYSCRPYSNERRREVVVEQPCRVRQMSSRVEEPQWKRTRRGTRAGRWVKEQAARKEQPVVRFKQEEGSETELEAVERTLRMIMSRRDERPSGVIAAERGYVEQSDLERTSGAYQSGESSDEEFYEAVCELE